MKKRLIGIGLALGSFLLFKVMPVSAQSTIDMELKIFTFYDQAGNFYDMFPVSHQRFLMIANDNKLKCIGVTPSLTKLTTFDCRSPIINGYWKMRKIINTRTYRSYVKFEVSGTNQCMGRTYQIVNCHSPDVLTVRLPRPAVFELPEVKNPLQRNFRF